MKCGETFEGGSADQECVKPELCDRTDQCQVEVVKLPRKGAPGVKDRQAVVWCETCERNVSTSGHQHDPQLPIEPAEVADSSAVNHPQHYARGGLEAIDAIEAFGLNFHLGNVLKYVVRADAKGKATEDLKKAAWYLAREIDRRAKLKQKDQEDVEALVNLARRM